MTGISSSCGACKFLRRRCTNECIFAPYFCYEQAASHFAAVHRIFGASNVSKLLSHLPVHSRNDAAITISYEALSRIQDPVYGCVAHIYALQQQVASLEEEIEILGNQMANIGANIAPYEISNPYFAAQSEIGSNCSNQQSLPILYAEASGSCSHTELQTVDEISEGFLSSSNFERLIEELNMDYFLLEELSQDYHYMHS